MSTNAYEYSESWHFGGKRPAVYYGWGVTTSSTQMRVGHFKNRRVCRKIEAAFRKILPQDVSAELIAACFAIRRIGDNESDSELARILIREEFENEEVELTDEMEERLEEILEKFL